MKIGLICLITVFNGLITNHVSASELPRGRAMWVWNSENVINDIINDVGDKRKTLYDFCSSPHGNPENRISVLFLNCKEALYNNHSQLRNFLSDATARGITVEYLDGDPSWATYNQSIGFERLKKFIEFNATATSPEEMLQGVQFDVEPYLLKSSGGYHPPYWDIDMDSVWALYVDYMDSCNKIIDSSNAEIYFGIAIPRWYENYVGNDGLNRLQSVVDYVAIMDYNEKSSVIIRDASNEINNATSLNKRIWIGVETKQVSPETVSFFEEGVDYMESQLSEVILAYGDSLAFSGIAIHAYRYYTTLSTSVALKNEIASDYEISLLQNVENPFRVGTTIKYVLPMAMQITISIYNVLGQEVVTLVDGLKPQGLNEVFWNAANFPSGLYFYQIKTNDYSSIKKMLLVR